MMAGKAITGEAQTQVRGTGKAVKDLPSAKIWAFAVGQFGWALLSGIISNWLVYFYQPDQETIAQGQTVFVPQGLAILGVVTVVGASPHSRGSSMRSSIPLSRRCPTVATPGSAAVCRSSNSRRFRSRWSRFWCSGARSMMSVG